MPSDDSGVRAARVLAEGPGASGRQTYGISELAEEFAVTTRTIRFYEDKRLIAPRRQGTARIYSRRDRARLALILRAKAIGASLAEIRTFLDLYGEAGEGKRDQLDFLIRRLGEEIEELHAKRALIDDTLAELSDMRETAEAARRSLPAP